MSIGDNIKNYRNNLNFTQKQLSEKSGVSESAIKYYESNRRNAKIETLTKIAEALGVDVSVLLQGYDYRDLTNLSEEDEDIYLNFLAPEEHYKEYVKTFKEFGYRVVNHPGTYFEGEAKEGFIYDILDKNRKPIITLELEGFCKLAEKLIQYKQTFDKSLKLLIDNEITNFKFLYEITESETKK